ncbi:EAL domain-containing protein [Ectothiorhodospiraceae bacterium WFHF3C12]|nr:EAL domain-containing protein [Ectothiorhodospiraceae bacterium WFHF3C12]
MKPGQYTTTVGIAVLFLGVYLGGTGIGLYLHGEYGGLTPLWPASAVSLYLLHTRGLRWWPLIVIGELLVALWLSQPFTMGLVGGVLQALEAAIALFLLQRVGATGLFSNVPQALGFCFHVCLLPPLFSAAGGALAQLGHGLIPLSGLGQAALTWWLGDAMALLILVPFLMAWWPLPAWSGTDLARWGGICGLQIGVGAMLSQLPNAHGDLLFFLLLPFVGWLALRFRTAGATSAAVILAGVVFGLHSPEDAFTTGVHVAFVGVSAMIGYVLAALLSRRDAVMATLTHQADHDTVTGLYNRSRLERELRRLHDEDGADGATHALLHVDLDHFKLVNDSCGHERADELLGDLGREIRAALPADALVGRLGGDEFLVLAPGRGAQADSLGETLRRSVLGFAFDCGERSFSLGASIGVAPFAGSEAPAAVMGRADLARHAAKREGGNRIRVFTSADVSVQRHKSELDWATDFEHALARGDLLLFAQRIAPVCADDGTPHFEVLLRKYENGRLTSPGQFLPSASRYGLMPMIDHWVITRSFEFLAGTAPQAVNLSINLAAETMDRPDFLGFVQETTERLGVDPGRVCFEVTERAAIHNLARASETMSRLNSLGFSFALDDFGAGVANFGYLNQLPVRYIKIDGQFIRNLGQDEASRVIVACVRDLARIHGMQCVAEFVESGTIVESLQALGIDYAQGYHIHHPAPLDELAAGVRHAGQT